MFKSKVITGTGSYLPEHVVTNDYIEKTSLDFDRERARGSLDEWCRRHTGAIQRHRVKPGEGTSDMATEAAQRALDDAEIRAGDLDLIVLSTITTDYRLPQTAALVQSNLGAQARFLQIDSACTGFIDALMVTDGLMERLGFETALVIGTDAMSYYLDPQRFREQTIFGDGAGAVILQADSNSKYGLKAYSTGGNGADGFMVSVLGGATKKPISQEVIEKREHYIQLVLQDIPMYGVAKMVLATREVMERAGLTLDDIDRVVPHQASYNIIRDAANVLELPIEKFFLNFALVGNTSSGSIPVALDQANRAGYLADGDNLLLPAVGAGMTWGAVYLIWYDYKAARKSDGQGVTSLASGGVEL